MTDTNPGDDGEESGGCPVCGGPLPSDSRGHARLATHLRNECPAGAGGGGEEP